MSRSRVEMQRAGIWPKAVPNQQHSGVADLAGLPLDVGRSDSNVARNTNRRSAHVPIISNEQAASARSLFANGLVIVAVSVLASAAYEFVAGREDYNFADFISTGLLIAFIFCGALRLSEERQPMKLSHASGRARHAFVAWLTTFAVFLAVAFTLKLGSELSRGAIISTFLLGLLVVPFAHMHLPLLLARIRKPGSFMNRNAIVIGARGDPSLVKFVAELVQGGYVAPNVVEFNSACSGTEWPQERKMLVNSVLAFARRLGPGEVYFALSQVPQARTESILRALALVPRGIVVVPDQFTCGFLRHGLSEIGNQIAVDVQKAPMSAFGRAIKRTMDIVLSAFLIVFFSPLFLALAVAVRFDSKGPALFLQERNGYQGRPFRIFKFRTMTVMEDGNIASQACKDDVRVTRTGRILRKFSLDELPQLFNVLRGEMSLIGPRPHMASLDTLYSKLIENYEIRQHVKPGITGWAQVNGLRGETQTLDLMYRRIEFDCWYAKNCSLVLDLRILARTVLEVLRPRNAY